MMSRLALGRSWTAGQRRGRAGERNSGFNVDARSVLLIAACWLVGGGFGRAGSIGGWVRNEFSAPVADVWVDAYRDDVWTASGLTDTNGAYEIAALAPGTYYVRTFSVYDNLVDEWYDDVVAEEGWRPDAALAVPVGEGLVSNINFVLNIGATITGRVTTVGGAAWAWFYLRDRLLAPLALSHALLGPAYFYWVRGEDLAGRWLTRLLSG